MTHSHHSPVIRAATALVLFAILVVGIGAWSQPVAAAPTCTTDCYVSPTGSDANDGATAATPLLSIQLAINTLTAGGTVHLAAGTYAGDTMLSSEGWRELLITKPLTMLGAGSATTIVQFRPETTGIEIEGNVNGDITFEGITFTKVPANTDAAGFNIRFVEWATKSFDVVTFTDVVSEYASGRNVMLSYNGTYNEVIVTDSAFNYSGAYGFTLNGTVSKLTVTNSTFNYNGRTDPAHGTGLTLESGTGVSNVLIEDSTFVNTGIIGAGINMTYATNVVIDNVEVSGNFNGINIWEFVNKTSNVEIKNSTASGNRRGILIGSETGKTVENVAIHHNDLSDNTEAGVLMYRAGGWGEGVMTNVDINRNDLSGNPSAGINTVMPYEEVDGTCNWWGAANGPGVVGPGSGARVSTSVDYTPWLYANDLDGPCYIGGTIEIRKVATQDPAVEFTFDVSWSNDNITLKHGESYVTPPPPLQPGTYTITEVNLPTGWVQASATCDNATTTPVETVNPSSITLADGDAWVCTFTNRFTNTCAVNAADSFYTDLLGMGMGNIKSHKASAKITLPNSTNLVDLYGQMVAKAPGLSRYVRFTLPGKPNTHIDVNNIAGPIAHQFGNFWYGADVYDAGAKPAWIKGQWFLQPSGTKGHIPRAFVVYATYQHATNRYVNIWDTFTPSEGEVYWDIAQGWTPSRVINVPIAAPLGPTTFNVELALVDNDKDARPVWVTVTAGNVSQTQKPVKASNGDQLNLMTFTLANVPEGTNEIVIEVYSPSPTIDGVDGDSATLVGMAANYQCAALPVIP